MTTPTHEYSERWVLPCPQNLQQTLGDIALNTSPHDTNRKVVLAGCLVPAPRTADFDTYVDQALEVVS